VDVTWLESDAPDPQLTAGIAAVRDAARAYDTPQLPPHPLSNLTANLRHGWDGDRPLIAAAREGNRVVAYLSIELPQWDNRHLGQVEVTVDPLARRRGLGRTLFVTGIERVRADGRPLVTTECFDDTSAVKFLETTGFERASVEVLRTQDPAMVGWAQLDRLYAEAEVESADYELVRIPGQVPAAMLDDVGRLAESINDAPTDDLDMEDEAFPADRIRRMEIVQEASGRRIYRLIVRHRSSGELAGHTALAVEIEQPWLGHQLETTVAQKHRGHRLGLLLKIGMLHWMRDLEAQLRSITTWNAASNAHMVSINEQLGYVPIARGIAWQRRF
jgi:GNAT superfamily N-acetyltransferase